uniref:Transposase n=1 Tax=Ascaris lumbricoides TaxID=6252 RepID=A0A0M3IC46_ASCLU
MTWDSKAEIDGDRNMLAQRFVCAGVFATHALAHKRLRRILTAYYRPVYRTFSDHRCFGIRTAEGMKGR